MYRKGWALVSAREGWGQSVAGVSGASVWDGALLETLPSPEAKLGKHRECRWVSANRIVVPAGETPWSGETCILRGDSNACVKLRACLGLFFPFPLFWLQLRIHLGTVRSVAAGAGWWKVSGVGFAACSTMPAGRKCGCAAKPVH